MQTNTHASTNPAADLQVVMSRFEQWAGKRTKAKYSSGVREVSYDEACAAGQRSSAAIPRATPSLNPAETASPAVTRRREAPAKAVPGSKSTARRTAKVSTVAVREKPATNRQAPFAEILSDTVVAASVPLPQPQTMCRKLSLRLNAAEHALLKLRASEAGVTPTAYARQCVLEVEQLREQVRRTLAEIRNAGASQSPTIAQAVPAGFWARLRMRMLGAPAQRLALRA